MTQIFTDISTGFSTFSLHQWAVALVTPLPGYIWYFKWLYLLLLLVLLVLGIVVIFLKLQSELKNRWLNFFFGNVAIGIALYFFRDQQLPYLGMDLLRVLHEVGILVWLNFIIYYYRTGHTAYKMQQVVLDRKSKYLPKAKK